MNIIAVLICLGAYGYLIRIIKKQNDIIYKAYWYIKVGEHQEAKKVLEKK